MDRSTPVPENQLPRHHTVQAGGITLHTVQAGPEDGPLVILLHGFPDFWFGWRHQIEPLAAAGFRIVAPDQRGYNLSDKPRGVNAYHIDYLAHDVIELIQSLGREKAHAVIGHDWGAAVAWHTAIYFPDRLAKLGIINVPHPAIMMRTLFENPEQMAKSWYIFFFQLPWLPEFLMSANRFAGMREMLRSSSQAGTFDDWELDRYAQAWSMPGALTNAINWYRSVFRSNIKQWLMTGDLSPQRVHVPTRMLWGVRDAALSQDMARPSIELCDEGELIFFPEATHWVHQEETQNVNTLLIDFLQT